MVALTYVHCNMNVIDINAALLGALALALAVQDRHHLGLTSRAHDNEALMYVLTLGVSDAWRKRGIASCMLDEVWQHAAHERCVEYADWRHCKDACHERLVSL